MRPEVQTIEAKHAILISNLTLIQETASTGGWVTILGAVDASDPNAVWIHTSQLKDLVFSVSLECGLYTLTLVRSRAGVKDTSRATSTVQIRVILDPGTAAQRLAKELVPRPAFLLGDPLGAAAHAVRCNPGPGPDRSPA